MTIEDGDGNGRVIVLDTPEGRQRIPESDVSAVHVESGSHWAVGMAVGAVLDVMLVMFVVNVANHPLGGGMGAGGAF